MEGEPLSSLLAPCRHDRATREALTAVQERRLRRQVERAYRDVRFWRDLFEASGLGPGDVRKAGDLGRLPLSSKEDLLGRPLRCRLASDRSRLVKMFTSGTTGPPMEVYYSRGFTLATAVYLYDHFRTWFGLGRLYRVLQLSSLPGALAPPPGSAEAREHSGRVRTKRALGLGTHVLRPVVDRFVRLVYFGDDVRTALPTIGGFSPDVIMTNSAYLRRLAQSVDGADWTARPRVLIATGEPLDEPTRGYAEGRLRSKVRQMYGSNETGPLALECLEGTGLHVFSDRAIVEVLSESGDPVPPGRLGEIVVTELTNGGMPLLRYRMLDVGYSSAEACPCGRSLPLLGSVEGRRRDCVTTEDGRLVTPKRILALMHQVDGLPMCQLVQHSPGSFTVRVFVGGGAPDPGVDRLVPALVGSLERELRPSRGISVSRIVDGGEPRGKRRPVVVEVGADRRRVPPEAV